MRKILFAFLFTAVIPLHLSASPCVLAPLNTYLGLGAGCSVGSALFSNFSVGAAPGATAISASAIQVSPLISATGLGLVFGLNSSAGPGEIFGNSIGYHISGASFSGSGIAMQGSTVQSDGVVTAVEILPKSLVAFDIGSIAELSDQATFSPLSSFDVSTEITIDGGTGGSATLDGSVANQFALTQTVATPELSSFWLLGSSVGALALMYRRARGRLDVSV